MRAGCKERLSSDVGRKKTRCCKIETRIDCQIIPGISYGLENSTDHARIDCTYLDKKILERGLISFRTCFVSSVVLLVSSGVDRQIDTRIRPRRFSIVLVYEIHAKRTRGLTCTELILARSSRCYDFTRTNWHSLASESPRPCRAAATRSYERKTHHAHPARVFGVIVYRRVIHLAGNQHPESAIRRPFSFPPPSLSLSLSFSLSFSLSLFLCSLSTRVHMEWNISEMLS